MRLPETARGVRLDHAVHAALAAAGSPASRVEVRRALRAGDLRVDGRSARPGSRAVGGEEIDVRAFVPRAAWRLSPRPDLLAQNPVVFEGPDWLAFDKAPGLPTLPAHDPEAPSLLHAALAADPAIGQAGPPGEGGSVHRLDNDTSGVVLFARTAEARRRLRVAFTAHRVPKGYDALVRDPGGALPRAVRADIETSGGARVRVRPGPEATCESLFELVARGEGAALVHVRTHWGRRHQVRAHLAWVGWPVLGDRLYADPSTAAALDRLGLHAAWIEVDGHRVEVPSGWSARFAGPSDAGS